VGSTFGVRWGWLLNATQVATMEGIRLEQVYELSTINFLNDLAYLKDKSKEEKRIHDEWRRKRSGSNSY